MTYQQRDLAIIAVAALGAGYLLGAAYVPSATAVAPSGDGLTIVQRLVLPPPRPRDDGWGDIWRVAAPPLVAPPQWIMVRDEEPSPKPPTQAEQRERALMQQQQVEPRDACYPGRRETFRYRKKLRWRCRYE
jgi:hypothetical protein